MDDFRKNAAAVVVPKGIVSFNENTLRCKCCTSARSYMKNKPIRFAIWLYANVGWNSGYLYSIVDYNSGN